MLKSNTAMSDSEAIKELKSARKHLAQSVEVGDASEIITTLKQIIKVDVNESILRNTGIGLYVNKLRSQLNKECAELAKKAIMKWKADIQRSSKPPSKAPSVCSAGASKPSTPAAQAKPSNEKPTRSAVAKSRPPERTPKGDAIFYPDFGG
ncbi:transcription elongation factor TFIIS [Entomophthora muscae]|uniref:Transcription elongation factor TFIIS n=1 Tax=Entomophthora muscae TaxID=34485 RepID=A0ACC2RLG2_9FUNG|nr:transcription elongation factor TFIIS [Entomophthora muscae]